MPDLVSKGHCPYCLAPLMLEEDVELEEAEHDCATGKWTLRTETERRLKNQAPR